MVCYNLNGDDMKKKVLFISSTGGHLNELLQLKSLFSNYPYLLVTEKDKSTIALKEKYNVKYLVYGTRKNLFTYFFKFIFNGSNIFPICDLISSYVSSCSFISCS